MSRDASQANPSTGTTPQPSTRRLILSSVSEISGEPVSPQQHYKELGMDCSMFVLSYKRPQAD